MGGPWDNVAPPLVGLVTVARDLVMVGWLVVDINGAEWWGYGSHQQHIMLLTPYHVYIKFGEKLIT